MYVPLYLFKKKDILQIVQIVCFLYKERGQNLSGNPSG